MATNDYNYIMPVAKNADDETALYTKIVNNEVKNLTIVVDGDFSNGVENDGIFYALRGVGALVGNINNKLKNEQGAGLVDTLDLTQNTLQNVSVSASFKAFTFKVFKTGSVNHDSYVLVGAGGEKAVGTLNEIIDKDSVILEQLGHNLTHYSAQTPTCTEIGWNAYEKCSRCDHTTYVELPMEEHTYTSTIVPPTTESGGYTLHTCSVCGDEYKDNFVDKSTYTTGDVNGNDQVDSADAIHLLRHTLFPTIFQLNQSGDFNGDASVDSADAIYLLRHTLFPNFFPLKASSSTQVMMVTEIVVIDSRKVYASTASTKKETV